MSAVEQIFFGGSWIDTKVLKVWSGSTWVTQ